MSQNTMKALRVVSSGKAEVQNVPIPELRDGEVLVKVKYVALNPLDWMNLEWMPIPDSTLGCDFSGTVDKIGPNVQKDFKVGDRVFGWVLGNNVPRKDNGAFAEYCAANSDFLLHTPESMSDEEAATPPAGIATAGMVVFQKNNMDVPGQGDGGKGEPVLIYGGTTATATLAIQYAKLAGYEVITTCSPRNFDHVKSLGADVALNYNDPECGKKIKEHTGDKLTKVADCICKDASPEICATAISSKGGTIGTVLPYPETFSRKDDVQTPMIFTLGIFGDEFGYGESVMPANEEDHEFAKRFYAVAEQLFLDGKVKVHPPKVEEGGLEAIMSGLEQLKSGKAGGVKIVYKL